MNVLEGMTTQLTEQVVTALGRHDVSGTSCALQRCLVESMITLPVCFVDHNDLSALARGIDSNLQILYPRLDVFTIGIRNRHGEDTIYVSVAA